MSAPLPTEQSLQPWLEHIGAVHVTEIELGLERVREVAGRLAAVPPANTVITVAGTNGKGSVVACLEALLHQQGYRIGCYTSPHVDLFNERIRVGTEPLSDADIAGALAAVESAREEVSLSYFEFATLAALLLFRQAAVDVAVLEVGLGGRLDAVNIVDPQLCVLTNIDLDHQDWLGDDRETIGREKAGIFRTKVPVVCGDPDPPASVLEQIQQLNCPLYRLGSDFNLQPDPAGHWHWSVPADHAVSVPLGTRLPAAAPNVACALQALYLLPLAFNPDNIDLDSGRLNLPGRQEWREDSASGQQLLLDVAHNPAAIVLLGRTLAKLATCGSASSRVIVVIAVMADKNIQDMACGLETYTDIWYIAQINVSRCMPAKEAVEQIQQSGTRHPIKVFDDVVAAYRQACNDASEDDLIVVTGSFHTVAAVRSMTRARPGPF